MQLHGAFPLVISDHSCFGLSKDQAMQFKGKMRCLFLKGYEPGHNSDDFEKDFHGAVEFSLLVENPNMSICQTRMANT